MVPEQEGLTETQAEWQARVLEAAWSSDVELSGEPDASSSGSSSSSSDSGSVSERWTAPRHTKVLSREPAYVVLELPRAVFRLHKATARGCWMGRRRYFRNSKDYTALPASSEYTRVCKLCWPESASRGRGLCHSSDNTLRIAEVAKIGFTSATSSLLRPLLSGSLSRGGGGGESGGKRVEGTTFFHSCCYTLLPVMLLHSLSQLAVCALGLPRLCPFSLTPFRRLQGGLGEAVSALRLLTVFGC